MLKKGESVTYKKTYPIDALCRTKDGERGIIEIVDRSDSILPYRVFFPKTGESSWLPEECAKPLQKFYKKF